MKYQSAAIALAKIMKYEANATHAAMTFSCSAANDLFKIVGGSARRFDAPAGAINGAENGSAVLILADGYPHKQTDVPADALIRAEAKKLRLFIEFPRKIDGFEFGP